MKQYRKPVRLSALLLALTLAFSLISLPAAAEGRPSIGAIDISQYESGQPEHNLDTYSQWVEYKTDTSERRMDVSFDADIIPEKNVDEYGISSYADNYAINISQTGDIHADTAIGINATADGSGRISVSTGDIFSGDRGIWAQAYNGGRAAVTAQSIDAVDGIFLTTGPDSTAGITVSGDVKAARAGLSMYYEGPIGVSGQSANSSHADVIIGGTLSGQNPIVLGDEIGNDSLNLTVWRVQRTGEDGKAMPYDEQNKFIVSETFDPTIRYIIRVQQPEKGATLTVKDEEGNELKAIETASGVKIDGVGPLKEGDLLFVVAATDKGYEVKAVYGDEGKTQALKYDETSKSWFMTVPKGGGVVISADVAKKTFTISFYNGKTLLQTSTVEYGEMPEYDKDKYGEPTLAKTAQFTYSWNKDDGWTPTLEEAVEDASYYAKFTEEVNTYEVKFDTGEGGTLAGGIKAEGTYDYGTKITLPNATRDGYTLQYWTFGENKYNPNSEFTVSGTQTLTAEWQKVYTVTFDADGGTLPDGVTVQNYASGTEITLPNATREGYNLLYWTDGENNIYAPGIRFTVSENKTLKAVWAIPSEEPIASVEDFDDSELTWFDPHETLDGSRGEAETTAAKTGSLSRAHNSVPSSRADDSMSIGRADDSISISQTDDSMSISQTDDSMSISPFFTLPSSQTDDSVPISQADTSRSAGADEIAVYNGYASADVDLASVDMATDISCDNNDDVAIYSLANTPDALKETAKQEIAALKRNGYKIDCGFVLLAKSNGTAACTIKLSAKDVPDGAQIIVNGAVVQTELKDGYFVFDVTLPAKVLVAH